MDGTDTVKLNSSRWIEHEKRRQVRFSLADWWCYSEGDHIPTVSEGIEAAQAEILGGFGARWPHLTYTTDLTMVDSSKMAFHIADL